eukprot:650683-Prymnesium_polylepis.1
MGRRRGGRWVSGGATKGAAGVTKRSTRSRKGASDALAVGRGRVVHHSGSRRGMRHSEIGGDGPRPHLSDQLPPRQPMK